MKVLIVCSGTSGKISPFIKEQVDSLIDLNKIEVLLFQIKSRGCFGYLSHLKPLLSAIQQFRPDIIHAHYGLSGLLANLQRKVPVLTTFHGSDVNNPKILKWSKWAHLLSAASIFVEEKMTEKFLRHHNDIILPCGVDLSNFHYMPKLESQAILNMQSDSINILFSSGFDNPIKNYPLAREALDIVEREIDGKVNLIELKGLSRELVKLYLNASDCALLISSSEGSPQFIKEAMACNCPIVATDVGDVNWVIGKTKGCFITSPDIADAAEKVISAINFSKLSGRTNGRDRIISLRLDTRSTAKRVMEIYESIV